ncbi:MAG: universal stress protein [Desulfosarcinaceae bacterium]|jgi:nucleotide-binding universal stress UspA family protein
MRILVAYNGSASAKHALTIAQRRARALSGELVICSSADGADLEESIETTLKNNLREAEMLCKACGVTCMTQLAIGKKTAAEDILACADEQKVDEIVVGIKKRSQLGKMIFGSTARMLIMEAPCPVLTVK